MFTKATVPRPGRRNRGPASWTPGNASSLGSAPQESGWKAGPTGKTVLPRADGPGLGAQGVMHYNAARTRRAPAGLIGPHAASGAGAYESPQV